MKNLSVMLAVSMLLLMIGIRQSNQADIISINDGHMIASVEQKVLMQTPLGSSRGYVKELIMKRDYVFYSEEGPCLGGPEIFINAMIGKNRSRGYWVTWFFEDGNHLSYVGVQKMKTEPNKAVVPIPVAVTPPACAGVAPSTSMAHL